MKAPALLFAVLLAAQSVAPVAGAQSSTETATSGTRTFVPSDFAQFAPQTALDMIERVPGFSIREEDSDRGLGQASGNVLVNGQRVSGKSNDVVTALSQIPARNVERIEIADGATMGIPGLAGQIANVVVLSSGISGQYGYYPEFRRYYADPRLTRFDLSATGRRGPVEYTVALDNRSGRSAAGGPTDVFDGSGGLIENRVDEWRGNSERPRLSGKLVFDGPGASAGNLNLSYTRVMFDYLETGTRTGGLQNRDRRVTIDEEGDIYEIGGDYEFGLATGRLKLIGVASGNSIPSETNVFTQYHDGSPETASRSIGTGDETERIARGEYQWKRGVTDWQLSAEGAFNRLDNVSKVFERNAAGIYEEIPLPGGTARVEEDRYEIMGSFGRPLSPTVALKVSLGGEYSKLTAGGGTGPRTFYRPKGEISTAWKASPRTDVNVKLARRVGQLNFYDFLASVNLRDDIQTSANPDLVPQQSWDLDVEAVRNLGTLGTATVRAYGRLIDDIIDYIPIGENGESPGNLDQATVYGIDTRATFNLDGLGWKGVRIDASAQVEESEVEDPLTGEKRPISNNLLHGASLSVRYDIPGTSYAVGTGASYYYYAKDYRLTEVGRLWEGPVWGDVYVEHKNFFGLALRGGIYNLYGADSMWDRTVYTGRRTGTIQSVEKRDRTIGPILSFSIRGKF